MPPAKLPSAILIGSSWIWRSKRVIRANRASVQTEIWDNIRMNLMDDTWQCKDEEAITRRSSRAVGGGQ
jgi:hypothetical protein